MTRHADFKVNLKKSEKRQEGHTGFIICQSTGASFKIIMAEAKWSRGYLWQYITDTTERVYGAPDG